MAPENVSEVSFAAEEKAWNRAQHEDQCRACTLPIIWWVHYKRGTRKPKPERRTLCYRCLAKAFARAVVWH